MVTRYFTVHLITELPGYKKSKASLIEILSSKLCCNYSVASQLLPNLLSWDHAKNMRSRNRKQITPIALTEATRSTATTPRHPDTQHIPIRIASRRAKHQQQVAGRQVQRTGQLSYLGRKALAVTAPRSVEVDEEEVDGTQRDLEVALVQVDHPPVARELLARGGGGAG